MFETLVELDDAGRAQELAGLEARDPELFQQVVLLLEADRTDGEVFSVEDALDSHRSGERIGAYRLEREIGRGGMGVVFLGRRDDGAFEGQVALKLLAPHFATPELVERFLLERNILVGGSADPFVARLLPPLVIEDEHVDLLLAALAEFPSRSAGSSTGHAASTSNAKETA